MGIKYKAFTFSGPNQVTAPGRTRARKWISFPGVDGEATLDLGLRKSRCRIQSWLRASSASNLWTKIAALRATHNTTAGTLSIYGTSFTQVLIAEDGIQCGERFYKRPEDDSFQVGVSVEFILPEGL